MRVNAVVKKAIFVTYMGFVVAMTIGWYPEKQNREISKSISELGKDTRTLCVMAENQKLFTQEIKETGEAERLEYQQADESARREGHTKRMRKSYQGVLERIVEAEAGDQDLKGRILVANVVMNRVRSLEFPNTVRGVVFEPHQFSPISNGSYYSVRVSKLTKKAVQKAIDGIDYSRGALYFMCRSASASSNVAWFDRDLRYLFSHGCHEFFL